MSATASVLCMMLILQGSAAERQGLMPDGLKDRVASFWTRLEGPEPESTSEWVFPPDLKAFQARAVLPISGWELVSWEPRAGGELFLVTVRTWLASGPGRVPVRVTQQWLHSEGKWWLRVPGGSAESINRMLYGGDSRPAPRQDLRP